MKCLLNAVILTFSLTVTIATESPAQGFTKFHLQYALITDNLKTKESKLDELMALSRDNPKVATFIADFWYDAARVHCHDYLIYSIRILLKKSQVPKTKKAKLKLQFDVIDTSNRCMLPYYFDNWEKINKTIIEAQSIKKR